MSENIQNDRQSARNAKTLIHRSVNAAPTAVFTHLSRP
jgi:hypothetical protein